MSAIESHSRVNAMFKKAISGKEIEKCYNEWAQHYDNDVKNITLEGYDSLINAVEKYYNNDKHIRILDVGAGTGHVGEKLTEVGFDNLEAVDPSAECLKLAKEKNVYKRLIHHLVGPMPMPLSNETYDCVVALGVFAPGHLDADSIPEMSRLLKKGGLMMLQGNYHYWSTLPAYYKDMKTKLDWMVESGELEQVEWNLIDDYTNYGDKNVQGLLFIYRKR